VAETLITGIRVAEQPGPEHAIARAPTAVTAFVGRTLRGPINRPIVIHSFTDFQAVFGGLWQPSTLSYAVEQYFENGGGTALIVRVISGGARPTLALRAGSGWLTLAALEPGTREFLRASVDYDGIGDNEDDRFNLVIQRVRAPGSEHIEDQEIFRRLSIRQNAGRYVVDALTESTLARVIDAMPLQRPDRTLRHDGRGSVGYVPSNPDGDDGAPLTDYDVIGSGLDGTGLFALKAADHFNLLCIPPLTRETDVGPSTLLVAARFCRERNAMLIVDPPSGWDNAGAAIRALCDWHFLSENALMYFPRMLGYDRLRGRFELFAPSGAIAGMLARSDEVSPVWSAAESEEAILRPGYRPLCSVSDGERVRLAQLGVNALPFVRTNGRQPLSARTLAGGSSGAADWKYLTARRLALCVVNSIERGTRWVVFETHSPALRKKVASQVEAFLAELDHAGAFIGHPADETYFVICDERLNGEEDIRSGTLNILFGFAAQRDGEYHAYIVSHTPATSRVRHVSVNRLETGGHKLEEEMEAFNYSKVILP
jgi:phage tail sheath protein FI